MTETLRFSDSFKDDQIGGILVIFDGSARAVAGGTSEKTPSLIGKMDELPWTTSSPAFARFSATSIPSIASCSKSSLPASRPRRWSITCSDSRVDPFLFTNAQPGQLFVIRNAGNLVPKYDGLVGGVTATIEFAVVGLRVPNIIVCGHSGCGAIHGLLHPDSLQNMPHVANWLSHHAEPVLEILNKAGRLGGPDEMQQAVDANVLVQLENLRGHPCVAESLKAGKITLARLGLRHRQRRGAGVPGRVEAIRGAVIQTDHQMMTAIMSTIRTATNMSPTNTPR